jgi:hypothetical protein
MACCGQRRQQLSQQFRSVPVRPVIAKTTATTWLEFLGESSVVMRGPASLKTYHFPARGQGLEVDLEDAAAFLRLGHFRAWSG